eukprot:184233-Rhodomonas_salina.2
MLVTLCGASSSGKTTLLEDLKQRLESIGIKCVEKTETARQIMREKSISKDDLKASIKDPENDQTFVALQQEIMKRQSQVFREAQDHLEGFVLCDRGPCPLGFIQHYLPRDISETWLKCVEESSDWKYHLSVYSDTSRSLVVLVSPLQCFPSGGEEDGVRLTHNGLCDASMFTNSVRRLLEKHKIPFLFLEEQDRQLRVDRVVSALFPAPIAVETSHPPQVTSQSCFPSGKVVVGMLSGVALAWLGAKRANWMRSVVTFLKSASIPGDPSGTASLLLVPVLGAVGAVWWGLARDPTPTLFENDSETVSQACAHHLGKAALSTVEVTWKGERTIITRDPALAMTIFKDTAFNGRFGTVFGLSALGMMQEGLIWNNDIKSWKAARQCFQASLNMPNIEVAAETAARFISRSLEQALCNVPESERKQPVQYDMLGELRSAMMVVALSHFLGIEEADFPDCETMLEIRESVVKYFKAWEYFLLREEREAACSDKLRKEHDASVARLKILVEQHLLPRVSVASAAGTGKGKFAARMQKLDHNSSTQLIIELLLATTDTSSVSLFYLLFHLASPSGTTLQSEMRSQYLADSSSFRGGLAKAALYEAMRVKPVGPVIMRQAVSTPSAETAAFQNLGLAKGDNVIVCVERMNMDPKIWGRDAAHFRAQRFLDEGSRPMKFNQSRLFAEGETGQKIRSFMPFGDGPKGCVGNNLAEAEMTQVLCAILTKASVFPRQSPF